MHLSSSLIFRVTLVGIFNLAIGGPIPPLSTLKIDARANEPAAEVASREAQGFTIGTPCFGSSKTGCTLKKGHKRVDGDIIPRDPEAAPEPQGFTIGTPCFGSKQTGCTLKKGHKRAEADLVTRDPEPAPEPQGFTIGTPCFGSKKTGCTLKKGHKRED